MMPLYSWLGKCLASSVGRQSLLWRSVTLANHGHEGQDQAAYSIPEGNQDEEDVGKKEVEQRDLGIGLGHRRKDCWIVTEKRAVR
jgi:hypothetical protein